MFVQVDAKIVSGKIIEFNAFSVKTDLNSIMIDQDVSVEKT